MTDLNKNSTLANTPVSSITPVDNLPSENPSKYDEVLNQYSESKPESNSWAENLPKTEPEIKTESIPEAPIETPPIVEPAPQPEIEVTPEPEFLNKTPDQIKQEINQILDDTPVDSSSTIIPPVKPKINIFQIIFVLSIVIFLVVVSIVAFTYFKSQKNSSTIDDQSSTISDTPTPVSSVTCTLNDKTYKVGEGFPSADGCNTCSCSENGSIACTEKACESTKSATQTATKSATVSAIPKDWKTYTNSTYKFSLSYPSNWVLKNKSTKSISLSSLERDKILKQDPVAGPDITIDTYNSLSEASNNSPKVKTLKDLAINMTDPPEENYKEINIGGVSGFEVITDYPYTRIYLQKGSFIYSIYDESLDTKSIEKQIINTLKFN